MTSVNIILLLCLPVFFAAGIAVRYIWAKVKLTSIEQQCIREQEDSRKKAEQERQEILLDGRNRILEEKKIQERENREIRLEQQKTKERLLSKEEMLDAKAVELDTLEDELNSKIKQAEKRIEDINTLEEEAKDKLESIAGLTRSEACNQLMAAMQDEARRKSQAIIRKIESEAEAEGDKIAQKIILSSMQRMAGVAVADNTITSLSLPNDDVKGRIIGREGRNIRSLETLTGVDIIIDDTPDAVVISSFNPVRREIARRSLELLVQDGRIHPSKIEETVARVEKETEKKIFEEGEKTIMELGLPTMSNEMIRSIGRLYFRRSYGQNILAHSRETAVIAGMIASELGLNAVMAKRGALLHDIGKGAETESEQGHAEYGADLAARLGENSMIVNMIRAHHNDVPAESLEAIVVQIADAISASRPGARSDTAENHIKRLDDLEKIALSFEGVEKAFATQAGRDLRIIVDNKSVSDTRAEEIAKGIADRISLELKFPGKIKVTIIRESRFVEFVS